MILSKNAILKEIENGNIIVDPFKTELVKDQSIDVRLGQYLWVWNLSISNKPAIFDISNGFPGMNGCAEKPADSLFFIAHTLEFIGTKAGSNILPTFKLKSSAGRLGIMHTLAGHGEVGFHNRWALEFTCKLPIVLQKGMSIGQIYFTKVEGAENEDYSKLGTYQNTNDLEQLKANWKPEDLLPPDKLKVIL